MAGWLAPLLEDLPARRVQQAADALRLLDQPPTAPLASSLPALGSPAPGLGALSKPVLHQQLVSTYGPMVELLLDSQPSVIAAVQVPALQERLVAAGLSRADVEEACRTAQVQPEPAVDVSLSSRRPPCRPLLNRRGLTWAICRRCALRLVRSLI